MVVTATAVALLELSTPRYHRHRRGRASAVSDRCPSDSPCVLRGQGQGWDAGRDLVCAAGPRALSWGQTAQLSLVIRQTVSNPGRTLRTRPNRSDSKCLHRGPGLQRRAFGVTLQVVVGTPWGLRQVWPCLRKCVPWNLSVTPWPCAIKHCPLHPSPALTREPALHIKHAEQATPLKTGSGCPGGGGGGGGGPGCQPQGPCFLLRISPSPSPVHFTQENRMAWEFYLSKAL